MILSLLCLHTKDCIFGINGRLFKNILVGGVGQVATANILCKLNDGLTRKAPSDLDLQAYSINVSTTPDYCVWIGAAKVAKKPEIERILIQKEKYN